jgi:hypothetical protein
MQHSPAQALKHACGIIACLAVLTPGTARALSCVNNWVEAPRDGAVGVPTNTLLWGSDIAHDTSTVLATRLIGPSGPVQLEQRYLPVYSDGEQKYYIPVLVPATELAPNARYQIEVRDRPRASFVTASGAAEQAPALPELLSSAPAAGEGGSRWRNLEFSHGGILIGDADGALGAVSAVSDLLPDTPDLPDGGAGTFRELPDSPAARWLTTESSLSVGLGGCMVWPDASVERVQARFGTFDLAGNFSGWVEVPDLALPTPEEAELAIAERRLQAEADREDSDGNIRKRRPAHVLSCDLPSPTPRSGNGAFGLLALAPLFISVVRRRLRLAAPTPVLRARGEPRR